MAAPSESLATIDEVESTPQGVVKRWVSELDLARGNQETWHKCAEEIWDLYRSKNRKAHSFNILWSNTETLRPALYNSSPRPDVRRRFRDPDPLGKVASSVLQRALTYSIDSYDFDKVIQSAILDVILPGRGLARVKYVPRFRDVEEAETDDGMGVETEEQEPKQEVYDESALCAYVKWDAFLHGAGNTWEEIGWIAFEHCLPYNDLVKMFGREMADAIPLEEPDGTNKKSSTSDRTIRTLLKTGTFWEIWDREKTRVLFICESYKVQPLRVESDPLGLSGFFPIPRPIYAIEDSNSLIPAPLYEKYKPQAEELNRITARINKIVDALKVRGAYASNIAEVAKIIEAGDNQMLPIENASAVAALGGLDKAIWLMPVEKLVLVLRELYVAREQTLKTIYEITGLGDIMRGVSNPHETLGAQQLKSQWGTMRLQRLQREVQRFTRDLLRMKGEIVSEHFSVETLMNMTGVALPTVEQKMQAQQIAAQTQQQQQPVPPEVQKVLTSPTWDDVMGMLKADGMRQYRVGIETDSTVQETLQRDTQDMQNAITSVVNLFTTLGPAVQEGILSVEMVKQLATAVTRNARMGQPVEDVIDQIQQPPPKPPEEQDKSLEVAQVKAQSDQQIAQMKGQMDQQAEAARLQAEQQSKAAELAFSERIERMKAEFEAQQAKQKNAADALMSQLEAERGQQQMAADQAAAEREHAIKLTQIAADRDASLAKIASDEKVAEIKMRLEYDREIEKAHIVAQTALDVAQIGAQAKTAAAAKSDSKGAG